MQHRTFVDLTYQCISAAYKNSKVAVRIKMSDILHMQIFTEENLAFQEKIIERSGLGDETGLSDGEFCDRDCPCKRF